MRMLRRNWAAGELRVLLLALVIAVASVTTVGFFADRVQAALDRQANELLGGDLVVIGDKPLPPEFAEAAQRNGLAIAQTRAFPSMVSGGSGVNLAEIKAVSAGFPLRGRIRISDSPDTLGAEVAGGPKPGTVWIGTALAQRLGLKVGDPLQVGRARLQVAAIITREPDSVLDYFGIAPRVLMNDADVEATRLVQVGSRVGYRLLVSGEDKAAVQRFRTEMQPKIGRGQRMEGVRDARSEVRTALERAQRFLGLASLLSVVLASVAVALAARRFSQRQIDAAAMMRCLGATQADLFAIHAWQFAALGLAACALGSLVGYAAQGVLAAWLTGFFTVTLPLPGPMPALRGAVIGFVLLLGFTLPPLLRLRNVSTLRVLRRDLAAAEPLSAAAFALGLAALCALIVWQAGDVKLGSIAVGGFAAALAVAAIAGYAMIRLVARLRGAASGPWRYGLANLRRRTGASLVQIMALGLGLMAMLMLTLVRTELITKWQQSMPADMPNRFAINIQSDQLPEVKSHFAALKLATPDLYPMVRGRLVAIGDRSGRAGDFKDERAKRLVEREFNLSWAEKNRPDNKIVAGAFWTPESKEPQFSVEEGLAKTLGIKVGDALTFDVAGSRFTAKVTSLRKVDWDSFKPNFFVIASPSLLRKLSGELDHELPPAGGARGRGERPGAALSQRERDRPLGHHGAVPAHHRPGVARGGVRVPVRHRRGAGGALRRDHLHAGRTRLRRRDPAHARREPPPAHDPAARRVPHHRACWPGRSHRGAPSASRWCSRIACWAFHTISAGAFLSPASSSAAPASRSPASSAPAAPSTPLRCKPSAPSPDAPL